MMGGRRTRKKAVGEKASTLLVAASEDTSLSTSPTAAPRKMSARLSGTACQRKRMSACTTKMQSASTDSTKKMDSELACSFSAEPDAGSRSLCKANNDDDT